MSPAAKPPPKRRTPAKPQTTIGINIEGHARTAESAAKGLVEVMKAAYEVRASEQVMTAAIEAYRRMTEGPIYNSVQNCSISNQDTGIKITGRA